MVLDVPLSVHERTLEFVFVSISARDLTVLRLFEPCFLLLKTGVESREVDKEVTQRDQLCDWV